MRIIIIPILLWATLACGQAPVKNEVIQLLPNNDSVKAVQRHVSSFIHDTAGLEDIHVIRHYIVLNAGYMEKFERYDSTILQELFRIIESDTIFDKAAFIILAYQLRLDYLFDLHVGPLLLAPGREYWRGIKDKNVEIMRTILEDRRKLIQSDL